MYQQNGNQDPDAKKKFLEQLDQELEEFALDLDDDLKTHTQELKGGKVNKDRQGIQYYFLKMVKENITTRMKCNTAMIHMADGFEEAVDY